MNRKKRVHKKPQMVTKPVVIDSESTSEELIRLRVAVAQSATRAQQLREENGCLRATQVLASDKEVMHLSGVLQFECLRAEAFKTMIEIADLIFLYSKKVILSSSCDVRQVCNMHHLSGCCRLLGASQQSRLGKD